MSFSSQVKKASSDMVKDAMAIVKDEYKRIGENIIKDTSVDTGKLRNNWTASFTSPAVGVNRNSDIDIKQRFKSAEGGKDSKESLKSVSQKINKSNAGEKIYFTNSLSYAKKVEEGGYSKAPQGFLVKNVVPSKEVFK